MCKLGRTQIIGLYPFFSTTVFDVWKTIIILLSFLEEKCLICAISDVHFYRPSYIMRLFLGLKDFYGVVVVQLYVEGWGLRQTEFRAGFVP